MDAKQTPNSNRNKNKNSSIEGLKSVRAKALKQTQIRLKRVDAEESAEPRNSWQGIQTLKNKVKVAEEAPLESCEPSILEKMWANFQEMLGNR